MHLFIKFLYFKLYVTNLFVYYKNNNFFSSYFSYHKFKQKILQIHQFPKKIYTIILNQKCYPVSNYNPKKKGFFRIIKISMFNIKNHLM